MANKKLMLLALLLALKTTAASAATVSFISPDAAMATVTDHANSPTSIPAAANLIDGSGLTTSAVTLANISTVIHSNKTPSELWRGPVSENTMPITLTFDFNTPQTVGYVGLWQASEEREGVGSFLLNFFDDTAGTGNQIGSVFSGILNDGSGGLGSISLAGQAFDVGERFGVQSITMDITSIALPINPYGHLDVHFGEFMVAPVPIPPAVFMFLSGLAALSLFKKRKKK